MASATNELGQSVRRPVVRANAAALTRFDPIKDVPTQRTTEVVTAGSQPLGQRTTATRNGATITARADVRSRTDGERGVALPRRDYRRTVLPAGTMIRDQ